MSHAELFRVRVDGSEKTITFSPHHINDMTMARKIARHLGELIDNNDQSGDSDSGSIEVDDEEQTSGNLAESFETLKLDFREIGWLGSVGLNELIGINRKARSRGIRLVLTNVQSGVRDVFELTRLERMFELWAPVESAASPHDR